jgi:asparagine synthase (glutamine-hydrolysing)
LARDRFGEKPLYYCWHQGTFLFASELKALRAVDGFRPSVERGALGELLRFGFVSGERTIYQDVWKLPPGTLASVDASRSPGRLNLTRFWDPVGGALGTKVSAAPRGEVAVDELAELLSGVVSSRMVSDVPLGAFLSGGIDSSTVVALMQQASANPVRTFTIGFSEAGYDESGFARDVARHLGTDHTELLLSPADAMDIIPRLARTYCEPFADSSQIPTFLVSQLARQHVTVALSGDGGDELFGGYDRYRVYQRLMAARRRLPRALRTAAGRAVLSVPGHRWNAIAQGRLGHLAPAGVRNRTGERAHKLGRLLAGDGADIYRDLMSGNVFADRLVIDVPSNGADVGPYVVDARLAGRSPLDKAMLLDTLTYLPDDLLVKVDRASMANSLEVRVPLLDPEVFRFAWGLHPGDKVRDGHGKWVLRQLLKRHLPADLVDRPKMGFGVPIGTWLRGPLSTWAGELLDPTLMREQGYLQPEQVQALWRSHLDRTGDHTYELWPILMFQAWLQEWM